MKKLIVIGIVAVMVMGLVGAASASDTQWAVSLQAGYWNLKTAPSTYDIYNGLTPLTCAVKTTAGTTSWTSNSSFLSTQAGIYDVDVTSGTGVATTYYQLATAASTSFTFNLALNVQAGYDTANPISIAYYMPSSSNALAGTKWTVKLYRNDTAVATIVDNGLYGSANKTLLYTLNPQPAAGTVENWKLVASVVPEPGSILALASGLVGLAGFGIRRRK